MKGRSSRLPSAVDNNNNNNNTKDDWVDESWTVDCVCGVNFDDGEEMVNCDECGVWVHTRCSRYVKDDAMFSCDKCESRKSRNEREENEVAQLLVDLPTKTMRREKSNSLRYSVKQPFRPWADMSVEERVHVHGIPGGDPSLFEGLSSVFSRELWKCTGHVPKKFKFKYQGFSFCDGKKDCWEEKDPENHINEGAGLLFSLSKDVSARTQSEIPRQGGHGVKREENSGLEGESVDVKHRAKSDGKFLVKQGSLTPTDRGKVEVPRSKERGVKKKIKSGDKECLANTEGLQNAKNARKKGVKADDSSFNLLHSVTTHLKKPNIEISRASEEGIGIAPDRLNGSKDHGSRSLIVNLPKSKCYDEDLPPATEIEVNQDQAFQKSNTDLTPASTIPILNIKTESESASHCPSPSDDNKTDVIRQDTKPMDHSYDHMSEICEPNTKINNSTRHITHSLCKQELDYPDGSLVAASTGSSVSKEPLVLGGLPVTSSIPMKSRTLVNTEHSVSDVGTEENKRRATSRKTAKEQSVSNCTSKGPHVNLIPRVNVFNPALADSPMVADSAAPTTLDVSFCSGDGDSAVVATTGVEMRDILPHEARIPVSGLSRSGEKVYQSNILQCSRGNSTSLLHSTFMPNAPASLSDEQLALLLHQELNSSPRVPRVPCMRQAGSSNQSSYSAINGILMKRPSNPVKDNGSVSRRRNRDMSQNYRENEDGTPKMEKIFRLSDQGKSGLFCSNDASSKKNSDDSVKTILYAKKSASDSKTTTNAPDSFADTGDHNFPAWNDLPRNMFDDDIMEAELFSSQTLSGLIGKIMENGRRVTFEELCDAILPHWNGLRKQNGELCTFSSHSNAVLDCLSKRKELAHLVDHSTKVNDGRRNRGGGEEGEGRASFGECGVEVKEEVRGCSPHLEEFPKGKRKARKRRKVGGGTRTLLMMGKAEAGGEEVEEMNVLCGSMSSGEDNSDHETDDGGSETSSSSNNSSSDEE